MPRPIVNANGVEEGPLPTTTPVDEDHLIYTPRGRTPMSSAAELLEELRQTQQERDKWKYHSRKNEHKYLRLTAALDERGISARELLNPSQRPSTDRPDTTSGHVRNVR